AVRGIRRPRRSTPVPYTTLFRSDGSSVLAVGGYLIRSDRAARMERKWKAALSRYGVPYFHMVDCAHGNGVFQSLSKQQRVEIQTDRKSTRLNSSHVKSSYAGFCW